jgi:hypothetical protein
MIDEEIQKQKALAEQTSALQSEFAKFHESGIRPNVDDSQLLSLLKEGGREIIVEDGNATTVYDGERIEVSQALKRLLIDRREFVDARTLPREGAAGGRSSVTSKADLKTLKDKVAYVNQFGENAYLALPLTGQSTSEIKTFEQFRKLPISEKARLTKDPDYIYRLKPSEGRYMPGQAKINTAGIAKHLATRGKLARQ